MCVIYFLCGFLAKNCNNFPLPVTDSVVSEKKNGYLKKITKYQRTYIKLGSKKKQT